MPQYVEPEPLKDVFTCPHCDVTARHGWFNADHALSVDEFASDGSYEYVSITRGRIGSTNVELKEWGFSICSNCNHLSVWHKANLVYPPSAHVEEPCPDMPAVIVDLYSEADSVFGSSPRASAALLRLALQELTGMVLGEKATRTLRGNIEVISQHEYATPTLVMALDVIRHNGNEAVHPAEISLNDNEDEARYLFTLLNMICETFYSQPRRLQDAYERIPESKRTKLPGE